MKNETSFFKYLNFCAKNHSNIDYRRENSNVFTLANYGRPPAVAHYARKYSRNKNKNREIEMLQNEFFWWIFLHFASMFHTSRWVYTKESERKINFLSCNCLRSPLGCLSRCKWFLKAFSCSSLLYTRKKLSKVLSWLRFSFQRKMMGCLVFSYRWLFNEATKLKKIEKKRDFASDENLGTVWPMSSAITEIFLQPQSYGP